jgi:hypothetical protein
VPVFNVHWSKVNDHPEYLIGLSTDENSAQIDESLTLLLISTTNTAHALGEVTDFIEYYKQHSETISLVGIAATVKIKNHFLFELICLFIPIEKILILETNTLYKCSRLITYRLYHFNWVSNWQDFEFLEENVDGKNRLTYTPTSTPFHFLCNSDFLFEKVREIYLEHHHKYQLYDKIMLIKTNKDPNVFSTNRCMAYPSASILDKLKLNNIHFLNIYDLKSIEEYICIFYHAKKLFFSYGGPACTNRFFCNPDAQVTVLCNDHYKSEWHGTNEKYGHIGHSHLFPVKKQICLLGFENYLDDDNLQQVLNIANYDDVAILDKEHTIVIS